MEVLQGIRCLYTTDTISLIELTTNYRKLYYKLPYTKEYLQRNRDKGYKIVYKTNIKEYCKDKNISCKSYFNILHKDIE